MRLTQKIKEKIKQHAKEESPRECCGVIISVNGSVEARGCQNISSIPEINFKVSPQDYVKFSNLGKIEAIYHSHPKEGYGFSLADKQNYGATGERFILYSIDDDKFRDSLEEENSEYLGRTYKVGVSDCMNMFRDYYVDKFKRKITYAEMWPSQDYYFGKDGKVDIKKVINRVKYFDFSLLKRQPPKEHDLIILKACKDDSWHCHLAIHVGHGSVLLQSTKKKSGVVDYEAVIKKNVLMLFRPNFI